MKAIAIIAFVWALFLLCKHRDETEALPFYYETTTAERDGERITVERWGSP